MKIYAASSTSIDRYVDKDLWVLVTLGKYRRLHDDHEFNDFFNETCWVKLTKCREDSVLAGYYLFNGVWDQSASEFEPGAHNFYITDGKVEVLSTGENITGTYFYVSPDNIRIVEPVETFSTAEFFGLGEDS